MQPSPASSDVCEVITQISQDMLAATQIQKPAAILPIRTTSKTHGVNKSNTENVKLKKKSSKYCKPFLGKHTINF